MGDETAPPTASIQSATRQQTTQDLLADIFGSSNEESSSTPVISSTPAQASVQDILGLFGATTLSSASPVASIAPSSNELFNPISSSPVAVKSIPSPLRLVALTAYDANGLKITLTPSKDASRPNVLNVLAKFEANAGMVVEGVNFQAAVPKVRQSLLLSVLLVESG